MKTKAKVLTCESSTALVEVERMSACEGCHKAESGCSVCSLMGSEKKKVTVLADNKIGAKPGDFVFVESSSKRMLLYAACLFLLPLVLFGAGFGIASLFTGIQWIRMISGIGGVALAFIGAAIYSKCVASKRTDVEIVEIIAQKETSAENE